MKKIIFVVLISSMFYINSVYALNFSSSSGGVLGYICDINNVYPVKYLNLHDQESYFLNITDTPNTNLTNYDYMLNNDYPLDINDYALAYLEFKNNYNYAFNKYHLLTQLIIWDYLYPDLNLYYCDNNLNPITSYNEAYNNVKNKIKKVIEGPDFFDKENEQIIGENYDYDFEYMNSYYVEDGNGLEIDINNNILSVKGINEGSYNIIFRKIQPKNLYFNHLITDGENILFTTKTLNNQKYVMKVNIVKEIKNDNNILEDNLNDVQNIVDNSDSINDMVVDNENITDNNILDKEDIVVKEEKSDSITNDDEKNIDIFESKVIFPNTLIIKNLVLVSGGLALLVIGIIIECYRKRR